MKKREEEELARSLLEVLFVVMHHVAAEMRKSAPPGFEPSQLRVLALLSKRSRILKELAACQHVALPTMSRTISSLVARGLVERIEDPQDRRRVQLHVTDQGLAVLHELHSRAQELLAHKVSALTPEEQKYLRAGLEALRKLFATEGKL
jgi:DNA-binding MarR family transcriptional regulator